MIDPFDVLPFSPDLRRAPMDANQRYAYPALARDPRFDSLIVGTSVGRLLNPVDLSANLGGRFVNLSMNAATPWEQSSIFDLFQRHHSSIANVVLEIDPIWCKRDREKRSNRPFPAWMYDENPWNDLLPHLSFRGVEQAGRQAAFLLGLRPPRFGHDGYARYLPPPETYDLALVRQRLQNRSDRERSKETRQAALSPSAIEALDFVDHYLLAEMLAALPSETRKVIIFAPMHQVVLPVPATAGESIINECKARLTRMAAQVENAHVLDFMIESPLTREDRNFWDGHHFTEAMAGRLVGLIAAGLAERQGQAGLMDYIDLTKFR